MTFGTRISRLVPVAASTLLGLVVSAYAGLIPLGRWQLDEYLDFYSTRTEKNYWIGRLAWSPRIISEPIFAAYGWLVNQFHHQFITPLLLLMWLVLFAGAFFTAAQKRDEFRPFEWPRVLLAFALLAIFVSSGGITEAFYWPAGAVPYLLTIAASLLLFLQVIEGELQTKSGRVVASLCLVTAAGSSEAGATFTLCFLLLQTGRWLVERRTHRPAGRPFLWCLPPWIVSAFSLVVLRFNRVRNSGGPMQPDNPGYFHHPLGSILSGLREVIYEILGQQLIIQLRVSHLGFRALLRANGFLLHLAGEAHLWMEVLFFIAVLILWTGLSRLQAPVVRQLWDVIIAMCSAVLITSIASVYQLGIPCCGRHATLRGAWIAMAIAGLAIVLAASLPEVARRGVAQLAWSAPILLLLSVLSLNFLGPLYRTYKSYPVVYRTLTRNAASGFDPSSGSMLFTVIPSGEVISQEWVPLGTFHQVDVTPGFSGALYPLGILKFYEKHVITVELLRARQEDAAITEPQCGCARNQSLQH